MPKKDFSKIKKDNTLIPFEEVENKIVVVRGQQVLLDRDVAALYGVETREVNQAVRNNPRKFRDGYMFELSVEESSVLRSKLLTLEGGKGRHSKYNFTFFKVRSLKRELLELHKETDKEKQTAKMRHFGNVLTDIVMPDLQTQETESSLEINFFIGKIKHTVKRVRKEEK